MEVNTVSEKVKSTKIKFEEREFHNNTTEANIFLLNLSERAKQNKNRAFLIFILLIAIAFALYELPILGFLSIIIGLIALVWLGYSIFYIDFPTHLQLNQNILNGKKDDRYLWTVDLTKQILYEADNVDGELIRTFYIREPKKNSSFSFAPSELSQLSLFFELLSKILKYDIQLFYQSTYGIAIPLQELSFESIEKVKPTLSPKYSKIKLLLGSLWALVSIFSSKYDSIGSRYVGTRIRKWIFAISIGFGLGTLPTHLAFKPVYSTPYPVINNFFVDSGVLTSHHVHKGYDCLILTKSDGTKLSFYNMSKFYNWKKQALADAFAVKVWWFPLNGSNQGWISKIEMKGVEVLSPAEQKTNYQNDVNFYLENLREMYLFFSVAFFAWIWEFIVRYKINKQLVIKSETDAESSSA